MNTEISYHLTFLCRQLATDIFEEDSWIAECLQTNLYVSCSNFSKLIYHIGRVVAGSYAVSRELGTAPFDFGKPLPIEKSIEGRVVKDTREVKVSLYLRDENMRVVFQMYDDWNYEGKLK